MAEKKLSWRRTDRGWVPTIRSAGLHYKLDLPDVLIEFDMDFCFDSDFDSGDPTPDRFYVLEIWPKGEAGVRAMFDASQSDGRKFTLNGDRGLFMKYRGVIEDADKLHSALRPGLEMLYGYITSEPTLDYLEDTSTKCRRASRL